MSQNKDGMIDKQITQTTLHDSLKNINAPKPLKDLLTDLVTVTHNNALRTYDFSCILDGILFVLKEKGVATEVEMQNYITLARAIKEVHIQTKQVMSLLDAKNEFLGIDYVIGTDRVQIDVPAHINAQREAQAAQQASGGKLQ